jgi:hypothetical protein
VTVNVVTIFVLLLVYQLKHFLADYPLQAFDFMKGKFRPGWDFLVPLAAHCGVHAVLTYVIVVTYLAFGKGGYTGEELQAAGGLLAAFDFTVHFLMDRCKASPRWMGRWKALSGKEWMQAQDTANDIRLATYEEPVVQARKALRHNDLFWNCLGVDQLVHHLTHYAIILALVLA